MPLLDHFHPPLSSQRHWEGFHSAWANEIVRELNGGLLPQPYFAEPHISFGQQIEIDVASLRADESATVTGRMTYAPPAPTTSVVLDEEAFCEIAGASLSR